MATSKPIEQVDFPGETYENFEEEPLDFEKARTEAYRRVRKYDSDPTLLAWYDRKSGKVSPEESGEEEGGDPGWVNHAKSHGANLTVNVNHGEYIFMFKSEHPFPS